MQITNRTPWESPTQYVGKLPTSGKGVGVVVMDEGFDLSHPDLKGNVVGVATNQGDTFESDPLGHGTHTLGTPQGPQGTHPTPGSERARAMGTGLTSLNILLAAACSEIRKSDFS